MLRHVLFFSCLFFAALGCAPEPAPETETETSAAGSALVGGTYTTGDPAVVLIFVQNDTQMAACTGTVVSPHVVLTAAHCVDPDLVGEIVQPPYKFYVFLGDDLNSEEQISKPGNIVHVDSTDRHPMFTLGNTVLSPATFDVGVVVTKSAMPVPPMPMNRTALDDTWIGQPVRLVGYGLSKGGDLSTSFVKREGMSPLFDIDEDYLWTNDGDTHLCGGDSGGPMIITRNGVQSVAGVHSWVQHVMTCTGKATDMRVDVFAPSYVDGFIAEHDPGFVPPGDGSELAAGGGGAGGGGGSGGAGGVGGGGAGGSDGQGGAGAAGGGPEDGGETSEGGCSTVSATPTGTGGGWLAAFLSALAMVSARRRGRARRG